MSNPKYYWYTFVRQTINRYPDRLGCGHQAEMAIKAVNKALDDLDNLEDGQIRRKFIKMTMLDQTHTYYGAGRIIGISERTSQRWATQFIYSVARNMGFKQSRA